MSSLIPDLPVLTAAWLSDNTMRQIKYRFRQYTDHITQKKKLKTVGTSVLTVNLICRTTSLFYFTYLTLLWRKKRMSCG